MLFADNYSDDNNDNDGMNKVGGGFVLESDPKDDAPIVVKPQGNLS